MSSKTMHIFLLLFSCKYSEQSESLPTWADLPGNLQHLKYGFQSEKVEKFYPLNPMPDSTTTYKSWLRSKFSYAQNQEPTLQLVWRSTWDQLFLERKAWDEAGKGDRYISWGNMMAGFILYKCMLTSGAGPGVCPDPCKQNPCENVLHSTKTCGKVGKGILKTDYACVCLPGYDWYIPTGAALGMCTKGECRYGSDPNCGFRCNCESGECDRMTGDCPGGCKSGMPPGYPWHGAGCRIGNVAYHKNTEQRGTYRNFIANNSVDGNTNPDMDAGSCSHTFHTDTGHGWWRVDLGETHKVNSVTIYNRKVSLQRTAYLLIGVGSEPHPDTHHACYVYDEVMPNSTHKTFTCTSELRGRYVSIKREHGINLPFLNMCEVVVDGYVSIDCSSKCLGECDDLHGCTKCTAGGKLPDCEKDCPHGYYGESCKYMCGRCAASAPCNVVSGACGNGCDSWYVGPTCHTMMKTPNVSAMPQPLTQSKPGGFLMNVSLDSLQVYFRKNYKLRLQHKLKSSSTYSDGPKTQAIDGSPQELSIQNLACLAEYDVRVMPSSFSKSLEKDGVPSKMFTAKTQKCSKGGAVAGYVVLTLVLLGLAVGIVFYLRRKKDAKPEGTAEETELLAKSGSKQSKISKSGSKQSNISKAGSKQSIRPVTRKSSRIK